MRQLILRACALAALAACPAAVARAQPASAEPGAPSTLTASPTANGAAPAEAKPSGSLFALEEVERQLREQRTEIEALRAMLREQARLIEELRGRVEQPAQSAPATQPTDASELLRRVEKVEQWQRTVARAARDAAHDPKDLTHPTAFPPEIFPVEDQKASGGGVAAVGPSATAGNQDRAKREGGKTEKAPPAGISFSGDLRFRYESLYGQQNAAANPDIPGALGNPLSTRQRLRLRARLGMRGRIGEEFEWGLRLSTGTFADVASTNQTLTDFFTRKPFALDQAFLAYRPKALPGLQVQAGKFDAPWTRTELTWDNDISAEGLSESYTRTFEGSAFKSFGLVAWQLPLLERNSAFVLGADGRVDLSASGRAGRDLALYGAQLRTEVASKTVSLKLSAADLYFSGTQFITPAQFLGANIQFPVAVVIPASGTTPARTVTAQVSVPRDLLVSGNANLGLSLANTNAVNRDGRLSSGFNLVDLIARADITRSRKWPVMLLFNFVTNTQTRDVVTAGAGGADLLLPNDQGQGYWAEFQVGKDILRLSADKVARGDSFFNYTFVRAEKDAILSPLNGSDFGPSTDMRAHRFFAGYALDPRVALTFTGFFTQRPTGLLGAFGQTPPGSLNRTLTRLQFDTILRF